MAEKDEERVLEGQAELAKAKAGVGGGRAFPADDHIGRVFTERELNRTDACEQLGLDDLAAVRKQADGDSRLLVETRPLHIHGVRRGLADVEDLDAVTHLRQAEREKRIVPSRTRSCGRFRGRGW